MGSGYSRDDLVGLEFKVGNPVPAGRRIHPADELGPSSTFDPESNKMKEVWDATGARIDRLNEHHRRLDAEVGVNTERWPEPTVSEPDELSVAEDAAFGDLVEATDGCLVEPDGVCEHGHPSWAMKWGLI
jgi:hypothetical protein